MGPNDPHHSANPTDTNESFVEPARGAGGGGAVRNRSPPAGAGAPETVVAMVLGPDRLALSSEELSVFDTPPTELPFINVGRFLARIGVRVPALYHYDAAAGILLLEDIGDQTLRWATDGAPEAETLARYREAIDQLVRMQVIGTREADTACVAFQQRFDHRLLTWEFQHFLDHGAPALTDADAKDLRAGFEPVIAELSTSPAVLAHRDFHGWNVHVHRDVLYVIDFQDALVAPDAYDLASLLTDRDTADIITPAGEDALIAYFMETREQLGHPVDDPDRFRRHYTFCVLHRALKVIGRFRYLASVKGKMKYLDYLPHVMAQARRALRDAPGLDEVRPLLSQYIGASCVQ
jgi:aminoglycoside/choline kinase family phosphotransferase